MYELMAMMRYSENKMVSAPNDFLVRSSRSRSSIRLSLFDLLSLSFCEDADAFLLFVFVSVATVQFTTSRQSYLSSTVLVLKNDELTNNDLLEIIGH